MDDTIGKNHAVNSEFRKALQKIWKSAYFVATTNYDRELEEAVNAKGITYSDTSGILSIITENDTYKIIHLHGLYDPINNVDDIIAGSTQYQ